MQRRKYKKIDQESYRYVFRNESGAIDLASIMVGVIVIGLIGGVIAATVFAVIPWTQDNAAKHQLESVHVAQNAYHGLSSDPSRTLGSDEKRNSFTNSALLETSNLLTTGATYCTNPILDGKDYQAFAASASGTIFVSTNSNKTPYAIPDMNTLPCDVETGSIDVDLLEPYTNDPRVFPGNSGQGLENDYGVPVGTTVFSENFESYAYGVKVAGWTHGGGYSDSGVRSSASGVPSSGQTEYYSLYNAPSKSDNLTKVYEWSHGYIVSPQITLKPGVYSISADTAKGMNEAWNNWYLQATGNGEIAESKWTQTAAYDFQTQGLEITVPKEGTYTLKWGGSGNGINPAYHMIDNVKVVKIANK